MTSALAILVALAAASVMLPFVEFMGWLSGVIL